MKRFNRILFNKPNKFIYYLKSFLGYSIPKTVYQRKLAKTLAALENRNDQSYINQRVDYYNKLEPTEPASVFRCLVDHKYNRKLRSVYFFDTYEYTRWFRD